MKICDFSRVGKIIVNKWMAHLMSPAFFTIIFYYKGYMKVMDVHIPEGYLFNRDRYFEKYCFSTELGQVNLKKVEDYNILHSYLVEHREKLREKWGLSRLEYAGLLIGLRCCLIKNYSPFSPLEKLFLTVDSYLKGFKYIFKGANKE